MKMLIVTVLLGLSVLPKSMSISGQQNVNRREMPVIKSMTVNYFNEQVALIPATKVMAIGNWSRQMLYAGADYSNLTVLVDGTVTQSGTMFGDKYELRGTLTVDKGWLLVRYEKATILPKGWQDFYKDKFPMVVEMVFLRDQVGLKMIATNITRRDDYYQGVTYDPKRQKYYDSLGREKKIPWL